MQPGLAKLVVIPTVWGHTGMSLFAWKQCMVELTKTVAGGGSNEEDIAFIKREVHEFLKGV